MRVVAHRQPAGVAARGEPDQVLAVRVGQDAGPPATGRQRARRAELDAVRAGGGHLDGHHFRIPVGADVGEQLVRQRPQALAGPLGVETRAGALGGRRLWRRLRRGERGPVDDAGALGALARPVDHADHIHLDRHAVGVVLLKPAVPEDLPALRRSHEPLRLRAEDFFQILPVGLGVGGRIALYQHEVGFAREGERDARVAADALELSPEAERSRE